ncbi:MAG: hypothetical protein IT422_26515, partial [Pirellulaceae bacterium]|nr:hypothetical protein [Pirellulaceae bacterium]
MNWDNDRVPVEVDDVSVTLIGNEPLVLQNLGNAIQSLRLDAHLELRGGTLSILGDLDVQAGRRLNIVGENSILSSDRATLNGVDILVSAGGNAHFGSSDAVNTNGDMLWQASGVGSVLSLPHLTSIQNGTELGQDFRFKALDGGRIQLPQIDHIVEPLRGNSNGRSIAFEARGPGSTIDLSLLSSFEDLHAGGLGDGYQDKSPQYSELVVADGGTIQLGQLRSARGVAISLDGTLDVSTLEELIDGHLNIHSAVAFSRLSTIDGSDLDLHVAGVTLPVLTTATNGWLKTNGNAVDLSTLTNINGRDLYVSGGIQVDLPQITEVVNTDGDMLWQTSGVGSVLSLPHLTSFQNGTELGQDFRFKALEGGRIQLSQIDHIVEPLRGNSNGRSIAFEARGPGSTIDLSLLSSFEDLHAGGLGDGYQDKSPQYSELVVADGGTIQLGQLRSARGVAISLDGTLDVSTLE